MRETYKVIIWYDDKEYTSYIIDANTRQQAEKQAVAAFAKKHNVSKSKLTSHVYGLSEKVPEVMTVKMFGGVNPKTGKKRSGGGVRVDYTPLKLRQFEYLVTVHYIESGKNLLKSIEVTNSDPNAALLDGKRRLLPSLGNRIKIVKWETRRR